MRILYISGTPTHPTDAGNRRVTLSTCEIFMSLGHDVFFLYIDERGIDKNRQVEFEECFSKTKDYWKDRFYYIRVSKTRKMYMNLLNLYYKEFKRGHRGLYDTYPPGLHRVINELNTKFHFDACIVNYIWLTKAFDHINVPIKACYTHDAMAYKNKKVNEKCLWVDASQEANALQRCTDIFAIQDDERAYFQVLAPQSNIYTIYSKYDYTPQKITGNKNILFLSGNNGFNQNGLKWFVEKVYPLIRNRFPEAKLLIAGGICKVVEKLYKDFNGIELRGFVDNPSDFYSLGDVAINPTYQGTGLKIKTFEAIANDKVTLVHPHSTAGIYKKDTAPLFSSEKPEDWVMYLNKIWADESRITEIKQRNKAYIESMNHYILEEYGRFLNRI